MNSGSKINLWHYLTSFWSGTWCGDLAVGGTLGWGSILNESVYHFRFNQTSGPIWSCIQHRLRRLPNCISICFHKILTLSGITPAMTSGIWLYGLPASLASVCPNFWWLVHKRPEPLPFTPSWPCIRLLGVTIRIRKPSRKFSSSMEIITIKDWIGRLCQHMWDPLSSVVILIKNRLYGILDCIVC